MSASSPFTMRDYQMHTVAAHRAAHLGQRRPTGEGVVTATASTLATGMGKTVIAGESIRQAGERLERSVFFTHRRDLAHQTVRSLRGQLPTSTRVGLVMGQAHNEWDADVVVMSVPSVGTERQMRKRGIPQGRFGLGVADEMHHSAADTWQFAMGYCGIGRGMPWIGLTATLTRGDSRALGDTWKEVVADYDIGYGVRNGWLVKPRGIRIKVRNLMLDEVRRSRGDFSDDDLGDAMEDADAGNTIAKAYLEHIPGRRAAAFAPNQHSAYRFTEQMVEQGIPAETVTDRTSDAERVAIYERFRLGTTLVIWSVGVLTEGWDAPWCDAIIMATPTSSTGKYIQCVGRGLRLWKPGGKTDCVVLDVVGVSTKHQLVSLKDLAGKQGLDREGVPVQYDEGEEDTERGPYEPEIKEFLEGDLVAQEVDLFADSDSAWLTTAGGVWFIPTKASYWFLYAQKDGGWSLGRMASAGGRGHRVERDLTMDLAMAWAEKYANDEDPSVSSRSASWRKSRPSEAMQNKGARGGILWDGKMRQGEYGDLITRATASIALAKFASSV